MIEYFLRENITVIKNYDKIRVKDIIVLRFNKKPFATIKGETFRLLKIDEMREKTYIKFLEVLSKKYKRVK